MSLIPTALIQNLQLPNAVAVQYTAPSKSIVIVRHVVLINTTAGAVTVTGYLVPNGGTVTNAAKMMDAYSIAAHTAYVSPEYAGIVMNAGDTIQLFASAANSISVNASGIVQS